MTVRSWITHAVFLAIVPALFFRTIVFTAEVVGGFQPPDTAIYEKSVTDALDLAWAEFKKRSSDSDAAELARAWGELGMIYQAHQMQQPAATCYEHAVKQDPDRFLWHYLLAITAQDTGDFDVAAQHFSIATKLRPDYVAAIIRLAKVYSALRDDANAMKWFRRALEQEPDSAVALAGLGSIELRNSEYDSAIEYFSRALQANPRANQLYFPLAHAYRGADNRSAARNALQHRGDVEPVLNDPVMVDVAARSKSTQYTLERGYAESRAGNNPAAIRLFQTALRNNPDDVYAWVSLGRAYELSGDTQRALVSYQKALAGDPENIAANYRAGHLLVQLGRSDEALPLLRIAITGDAQTTQWRLVLANALMRTGHYPEAVDHYSEIDRLEPGKAVFLYRHGLAATAAGDCSTAREKLEAGFKMQKTSGEIIQALVRNISSCPPVSVEQKRWALEYAELLYNGRPNSSHLEALAMAAAANQQFDRAIEYQSELVRLLSVNGEAMKFARGNLDRYSRGEIAGGAWPMDAAVFSPPAHHQSDRP